MSTTDERPIATAAAGPKSSSRRRGGALVPDVEVRTYYDRAVLKQPTWKHWIPEYMFLGGLAAGSSVLAFGASRTGRRVLARRAKLTAASAIVLGSGALVADLGRPERFAHMLRVVKVTSPLSMGSWLLALYGPVSGIAAATELLGLFPAIGTAAEALAALLAPAVATYTAVVVTDTAIPAWHEARAEMPFLFAAGAGASAGALALVTTPSTESSPALRWAVAGALGEVGVSAVMEHRLGKTGEAYKRGRAGRMSKLANACALAGAVVGLRRGRTRGGAVVAGALVLTGSLLERFAVIEAGRQSAADPTYVVGPQRARVLARESGDPPA